VPHVGVTIAARGPIARRQRQEKAQYEAPRAPERTPFEGGVKGSPPNPSLKRQGEGRGAYSVLRVDVPKWYVFS
jgi:hypothetical protein